MSIDDLVERCTDKGVAWLIYPELVYSVPRSAPKRSGKTTFAAIVAITTAAGERR
jgi:hypothetical protein